MSVYLVPLESLEPFFVFGIELEGVSYRLSFRWNGRAGMWIMAIENGDGLPIMEGLRCVVDFPILRRFGGRYDLPPGEFLFVDTTSRALDPVFEDFGSRVQLYYFTSDETPAR